MNFIGHTGKASQIIGSVLQFTGSDAEESLANKRNSPKNTMVLHLCVDFLQRNFGLLFLKLYAYFGDQP